MFSLKRLSWCILHCIFALPPTLLPSCVTLEVRLQHLCVVLCWESWNKRTDCSFHLSNTYHTVSEMTHFSLPPSPSVSLSISDHFRGVGIIYCEVPRLRAWAGARAFNLSLGILYVTCFTAVCFVQQHFNAPRNKDAVEPVNWARPMQRIQLSVLLSLYRRFRSTMLSWCSSRNLVHLFKQKLQQWVKTEKVGRSLDDSLRAILFVYFSLLIVDPDWWSHSISRVLWVSSLMQDNWQ